MSADRIARILTKLKSRRDVKLGICLTEAEIATFESERGVTLPEGYRTFLLQVADGASGPPDYGLEKLRNKDGYRDESQQEFDRILPHIKDPFPFTKQWVWEDDDSSDEGERRQVYYGSIFLGTEGCGLDWHLIITGAERGKMWQLADVGICPTNPGRDFLTWFEDWLDNKNVNFSMPNERSPSGETY